MKLFAQLLFVFAMLTSLSAHAGEPAIGVVVMHGKGGSPGKHVNGLADSLERQGYVVANLEMPWSGRREYDVDVRAAEDEVLAAIAAFRQKGVRKVFVAGHSQGGLFALYFGGRHPVDGIVAIAPGGNVGNAVLREKFAEPVERARNLVKQGLGQEKSRFSDFEGGKGSYAVLTSAAAYLSWFDPDGAMNQTRAMQSISPAMPVLFIAPANDYPALLRVKDSMFGLLAKNPLTRLYEPNTSHLNAPTASAEEIGAWIGQAAQLSGYPQPPQ